MRSYLRTPTLVLSLWAWTLATCAPAMGATNVATGVIGDGSGFALEGGDGTGSATFTLTSTRLALIKQARRDDGTVLADGADVLPGQQIWFVLYVDNPTDYAAADLTLSDQLNEAEFRYVAGSLELASAASGADDDALWASTWTALSDSPGSDDEASAVDTGGPPVADRLTVGARPGQPNAAVTVPPRTVFAIRFRVTVN